MLPSLPLGWTAHQDELGRTFYHCAATGETSWNLPGAALPDGWSAHIDAEGRTFYHNASTGVTQWEPPSEPPAALAEFTSDSSSGGTTLRVVASDTLHVVQYILQATDMPEMATAIGDEKVQRIRARAQAVQDAFALPATKAKAKVISTVRDLTKSCLRPFAFNSNPLVAEVAAATIAGVAGLMEPRAMPGATSLDTSEAAKALQICGECNLNTLLLQWAREVSLGREDTHAVCGCSDPSIRRTRVAFSGLCSWLVTAFCRAVGYSNLTADSLWEWANCDPLWVAVLATGTFSFSDVAASIPEAPLPGPLAPPELSEVQNALAGAVLGLAGHSIVFRGRSTDLKTHNEIEEVSEPNMKFSKHWAKLAVVFTECGLLGPLLKIVDGPAFDKISKLASFFAKILQPQLKQDPPWTVASPMSAQAASASAGRFASIMRAHESKLWALFARVPDSGKSTPSFLKDCAEIAFCAGVAVTACRSLIHACLSNSREILECAGAEPASLTALCMLAANAGIAPAQGYGGACEDDIPHDGHLSLSLLNLQADVRLLVASHVSAWQGSVAKNAQDCWVAFLQGDALPVFAPEPIHAPLPFAPAHLRALGMVHLAPPELCCALDRQILTDAVRSPHGHTFEYAVLAQTLSQNGGTRYQSHASCGN